MAGLNPAQLIQQTQKLMGESKNLCDRSRQSVDKSKYLVQALTVSVSASRRTRLRGQRRKHLLAK